MVHIQVAVGPRVAVRHGGLAVGIAPVAETPVTGVVADAGVGNGAGEAVGQRGDVLRHEAAVGSADAADLLRIDERVLLAELLRTFDDVLGGAVAGRVHVTGRPFLPVAGGAGRKGHHIDHVTQGSVGVVGVAAFKIAARRTAAAVVVDDHRILLRRIEIRREIEAAIDHFAFRILEVPFPAFAQPDILEDRRAEIFAQLGLAFFRVHQVKPVGVRGTLAIPGHDGRGIGKAEALDQFFRDVDLPDLPILGIEAEKIDMVAVFGSQVDLPVGPAPFGGGHAGIEITGQRLDFPGVEVHQIQLDVGHARRLAFADVLADAAEGLGAAAQQHLFPVGREGSTLHEAVAVNQLFSQQGMQIHQVKGHDRRRTLLKPFLAHQEQGLLAVLRHVGEPNVVVTVGQALHDAGLQVVACRVAAAAPAGLPVVGCQDLVDAFLFRRPVFTFHIDQEIFGRCELEHSFGYAFGQRLLHACSRIHGQNPQAVGLTLRVIVFVGAGHPGDSLGSAGDDPAGGDFRQPARAFHLAALPRG